MTDISQQTVEQRVVSLERGLASLRLRAAMTDDRYEEVQAVCLHLNRENTKLSNLVEGMAKLLNIDLVEISQ